MRAHKFTAAALSALMLGGTMVGCTTTGAGGVASAGSRTMPHTEAAAWAKRATKAMAAHDPAAVDFAEAAVASAPAEADYRLLLGQTYLRAGRFVSARDAFRDVLLLQPANGRAALNLALSEIATGDWATARQILTTYDRDISPTDRGLALALAGDPAGAVALLTQAARQPGADAKMRQNLALSLGLAGQWPMARVIAAADLSPADLDDRMQQWIAFAQPTSASDQVASLLGVRAVADAGQPVALALVKPAATAVALAAPPIVEPVVVTVAAVRFGPRHEVVQDVPAVEPVRRVAKVIRRAVPVAAAPVVTPPETPVAVRFAPRQEVVQPLPVAVAVRGG
ncbi:tetratricopeptide repeat protein [Sphingomonas mollis]|uniref:Tetratricopeptide repeat protein n=1 Tax=Sphingomonas mollis TaxID=2795726 RepID=A0ABS0XL67_9SPHN|nr:tetratricopeptide repeat protein [Sphingomonas sp. BT553]MBJ6120778.1 tetratricopeptide repeat protein [Sphingomonas sp. BT553]